jgi:hypothetical protein
LHLNFRKNLVRCLHLEYGFVWCWNLDTTEGRIELTGSNIRSYSVILRNWNDAGNWKRKHRITLCIELTLEKAMDLS